MLGSGESPSLWEALQSLALGRSQAADKQRRGADLLRFCWVSGELGLFLLRILWVFAGWRRQRLDNLVRASRLRL